MRYYLKMVAVIAVAYNMGGISITVAADDKMQEQIPEYKSAKIDATFQYSSKNWPAAIERYTSLLDRNDIPEDIYVEYSIDCFVMLSRSYANNGQIDKALEVLDSLKIEFAQSNAMYGESAPGLKARTVALSLASREQSSILHKNGRYLEAVESYKQSAMHWKERFDESVFWPLERREWEKRRFVNLNDLNIADCLLLAGNFAEAKDMYKDLQSRFVRTIADSPADRPNLEKQFDGYLANVYINKKLGDLSKDKAFYQKAHDSFPEDEEFTHAGPYQIGKDELIQLLNGAASAPATD